MTKIQCGMTSQLECDLLITRETKVRVQNWLVMNQLKPVKSETMNRAQKNRI